MSCFCEQAQEDRCCCHCVARCAMICHAANPDPSQREECRNPTFRRFESERDDEV